MYLKSYAELQEEERDALQRSCKVSSFSAEWRKLRQLIQSVRLEKLEITEIAMKSEPLDVVKVFSKKMLIFRSTGKPDPMWVSRVAKRLSEELNGRTSPDKAFRFIVKTYQTALGSLPESIQEAWDALGIPHDKSCCCDSCIA